MSLIAWLISAAASLPTPVNVAPSVPTIITPPVQTEPAPPASPPQAPVPLPSFSPTYSIPYSSPYSPYAPPPEGPNRAPIPTSHPGTWANSADYPPSALRDERDGNVGFGLTIDKLGRAINCIIISSSGYSDLDDATCAMINRRARFYPATDKEGKPTTGYYANQIKWRMPKQTTPPLAGLSMRSYTVEVDGTLTDCVIEQAQGGFEKFAKKPVINADTRMKLPSCPIAKFDKPYLDANGQPVRIRVTTTAKIDLLVIP